MTRNKNLLIIEIPNYTDKFAPLPTQIKDHFNRILGHLKIFNPLNDSVSIELDIDTLNSERFTAFARRQSEKPPVYKIRMPAGISYRLWGASREFASDCLLLPWIEHCRVSDELSNKSTIKEVLANYAYFLSNYYVVLHEISHVVLGHSDFLVDAEAKYLSKFQDEKEQSFQRARLRKAYEAEADRQANYS